MVSESFPRSVLPIPERRHTGLTTYDAKDPDTSFPPIEPLLPPAAAPNVLIVLLDDVGSARRARSAVRAMTPTAERLAAGGPSVTTGSTPPLCVRRPGRPCSLDGTTIRSGWAASPRSATSAPGYNSLRPQDQAPLAETLKLNGYSHRPVRQVPRGAGVADRPVGPVRPLADRRRVRVLLRVHRRREQPVLPGSVRGHDPRRAAEDARGGLPPHRGPGRPGDRLGAPAEGPGARTGRSSCISRRGRPTRRTMCPTEWARQVRGASSPTAGTCCASRPSPGRRSSASSRRTPS